MFRSIHLLGLKGEQNANMLIIIDQEPRFVNSVELVTVCQLMMMVTGSKIDLVKN